MGRLAAVVTPDIKIYILVRRQNEQYKIVHQFTCYYCSNGSACTYYLNAMIINYIINKIYICHIVPDLCVYSKEQTCTFNCCTEKTLQLFYAPQTCVQDEILLYVAARMGNKNATTHTTVEPTSSTRPVLQASRSA